MPAKPPIIYLSADFGVPIFGTKGASIHVREMVIAFAELGHPVWVFSPAMHQGKEDEAGSNFGQEGLDQPSVREIEQPVVAQFFDQPVVQAIRCFSVLPRPEHLLCIEALRQIEKQFEVRTRLRQELRNLLFNQALFQQVFSLLEGTSVHFVYERYSLFHGAGIQLARRLGVPHLLEVNAPLADEQKRMRGLELESLARKTEQWIWQHTDQLFTVSNVLSQYAQQSYGIPAQKIVVLPNAINPRRFRHLASNHTPHRKGQAAEGAQIGFVGSLKNWHGTETLVQAMARVKKEFPGAQLIIIGDGPERSHLESLSQRLGLSDAVRFTGKVPYQKIPDLLSGLDIAVAPYIPHENFYFSPIKIFEYMAAGLPVVAAAIGQVREVIQDGETGLLYPPGDVNALAECLGRLLRDGALRKHLAKQGRQCVLQQFTWQQNARRVLEKVQNLLAV